MSHKNRVVLLIDMDCFYCQVEENLDPNLKNKPIAVVQYNEWRGGGIIAVNYCARDKGVTRYMRGDEAKQKCPEIQLVKVPQVRGKADLTKYRDAGKRVAEVLQTFTSCLERASVDEAYLDITEIVEKRINNNIYITSDMLKNTFVVGGTLEDFIVNVNSNQNLNENHLRLAIGGIIAGEIRTEIFRVTGYKCSAGIAHNKILAKLVCGLHKPNKQTILPNEAIPELYENLPLKKIKSLGGKFGATVSEKLKIMYMGELIHFSQKELAKLFDEKAGIWLYNIARGIDNEPVNTRLVSKSIGCCKQFQGRSALTTQDDIEHWLSELASEISERLEKDIKENNRKAKQMVVSFAQKTNKELFSGSRSLPLNSYEQLKILENAVKVIQKNCQQLNNSYNITYLGISVGNFEPIKKVKDIASFFKEMTKCSEIQKNCSIENQFSSIKDNKKENDEVDNFVSNNHGESILEALTSNDDQLNSVYLSSTQEDNSDDKNYVYYEELHPESVEDQTFININQTYFDDSTDSINQEIALGTSNLNVNEVETPMPSSFFENFYRDSKRDFNTSKILDEDYDNDTMDFHITETTESNIDAKTVENIDIDGELNNCGSTTQTCSLCKQDIKIYDYQSHMDFHFALNLAKKERSLYKTQPKSPMKTSPSETKHQKTLKPRKKSEKQKRTEEGIKLKSILGYFQNEVKDINDESSQICSECNKRIPIKNFNVHLDFHAAKKLHLEINPNKIEQRKSNISKIKGQQGISRFLNH